MHRQTHRQTRVSAAAARAPVPSPPSSHQRLCPHKNGGSAACIYGGSALQNRSGARMNRGSAGAVG
eukprot:309952-Rhodomonas_salina.1